MHLRQIIWAVLCLVFSFSLSAQSQFEQLDKQILQAQEQGNYPLMISLEKKAIQLASGQDSLTMHYANNLLATLMFVQQRGMMQQAIEPTEAILQSYESRFPESKIELYFKLKISLATLYQMLENCPKSIAIHQSLEDYYRGNNEYTEWLSIMGVYYSNCGDFEQANHHFDRCLELDKQGDGYIEVLSQKAELYCNHGRLEQGLSMYLQLRQLIIRESGEEDNRYGDLLGSLALLYARKGAWEKNLLLLEEYRQWLEQYQGKNKAYSLVLLSLGRSQMALEQYTQALKYIQESQQVSLELYGKIHPSYPYALKVLSICYQRMGKLDKALEKLLEAKKVAEQLLAQQPIIYGGILVQIAEIYYQQKKYEAASTVVQEIIAKTGKSVYYQRVLAPNVDKVVLKNQIAMGRLEEVEQVLFTKLQQLFPEQSEEDIRNFLVIEARGLSAEDRGKLLTILDLYYRIEKQRGHPQKQTRLLERIQSELTWKRKQYSSQKDQMRLIENNAHWTEEALDLYALQQQNQEAFAFAEQQKAVLLLEQLQQESSYALGALPDSIVAKQKQLAQAKDAYRMGIEQSRVKEEKDSLRGLLVNLELQSQDLDQVIKRDFPKYQRLQEREDINIVKVQTALQPGQAMINYLITDTVLHLFYVDAKAQDWQRLAINRKDLKRRVLAYQKTLSNYGALQTNPQELYTSYRVEAHALYNLLLAPVLASREDIVELIVIPDGFLALLPFESLLMEEASSAYHGYQDLPYVLNNYQLSYHSSAALWLRNQGKQAQQNNGEIYGLAANYALRLDSSLAVGQLEQQRLLRQTLGELPAARREVEGLQSVYKGFFAFDQAASEQVFKQRASDYAILHLATHGLLNAQQPMRSALAFSDVETGGEDNFLEAWEIARMQLKADLVVLSACETGVGRWQRGNGLASLARSFMYAGTPAVLASLWKVNDGATALLMEEYYSGLAQGLRKDEALAVAKRRYIAEVDGAFAFPGFWSPFIQMGNTQAVQIKTQSSSMVWLVGVLLSLGLLVGLWLRRKNSGSQ